MEGQKIEKILTQITGVPYKKSFFVSNRESVDLSYFSLFFHKSIQDRFFLEEKNGHYYYLSEKLFLPKNYKIDKEKLNSTFRDIKLNKAIFQQENIYIGLDFNGNIKFVDPNFTQKKQKVPLDLLGNLKELKDNKEKDYLSYDDFYQSLFFNDLSRNTLRKDSFSELFLLEERSYFSKVYLCLAAIFLSQKGFRLVTDKDVLGYKTAHYFPLVNMKSSINKIKEQKIAYFQTGSNISLDYIKSLFSSIKDKQIIIMALSDQYTMHKSIGYFCFKSSCVDYLNIKNRFYFPLCVKEIREKNKKELPHLKKILSQGKLFFRNSYLHLDNKEFNLKYDLSELSTNIKPLMLKVIKAVYGGYAILFGENFKDYIFEKQDFDLLYSLITRVNGVTIEEKTLRIILKACVTFPYIPLIEYFIESKSLMNIQEERILSYYYDYLKGNYLNKKNIEQSLLMIEDDFFVSLGNFLLFLLSYKVVSKELATIKNRIKIKEFFLLAEFKNKLFLLQNSEYKDYKAFFDYYDKQKILFPLLEGIIIKEKIKVLAKFNFSADYLEIFLDDINYLAEKTKNVYFLYQIYELIALQKLNNEDFSGSKNYFDLINYAQLSDKNKTKLTCFIFQLFISFLEGKWIETEKKIFEKFNSFEHDTYVGLRNILNYILAIINFFKGNYKQTSAILSSLDLNGHKDWLAWFSLLTNFHLNLLPSEILLDNLRESGIDDLKNFIPLFTEDNLSNCKNNCIFQYNILEFFYWELLFKKSGNQEYIEKMKGIVESIGQPYDFSFKVRLKWIGLCWEKDNLYQKSSFNQDFWDTFHFYYKNGAIISSDLFYLRDKMNFEQSGDFEEKNSVINSPKREEEIFREILLYMEQRISFRDMGILFSYKGKEIFFKSKTGSYDDLYKKLSIRSISYKSSFVASLSEVLSLLEGSNQSYGYKETGVLYFYLERGISIVLILSGDKQDLSELRILKELWELKNSCLRKMCNLLSDKHLRLDFIVGNSKPIKEIKNIIVKASKVDFPLLISGPSGSGKELVAQAVHKLSGKEKFIPINVAAIPAELIEAELFGYKKGAFTGANNDKKGLIEEADNGILFLDEIGELSLSLQSKLLRVLQKQELRPLGGNSYKKVKFRLISATNRDLKEMIDKKNFREDLYYRISTLEIKVPPLSERIEDIPLLSEYYFKKYNYKFNDEYELFFINRELMSRSWEGNIRELESEIKRIITFYPDMNYIYIYGAQNKLSIKDAKDKFERTFVMDALKLFGGNKSKTARFLCISKVHLYKLIKKYDL